MAEMVLPLVIRCSGIRSDLPVINWNYRVGFDVEISQIHFNSVRRGT
jgi:hypothetical protein